MLADFSSARALNFGAIWGFETTFAQVHHNILI
jgi:hypothetical protein